MIVGRIKTFPLWLPFDSMRQDVYDALVAFEKKIPSEESTESRRYVERMIKIGRRNGKWWIIKENFVV